jgi:hypothetical protein
VLRVPACCAFLLQVLNLVVTCVQIGVSGEHCGDPTSISFLASCKIDFVSCAPFRIPVAKVAAAQAQIEKSGRCCKQCVAVIPLLTICSYRAVPGEETFLERADLLSNIVSGKV